MSTPQEYWDACLIKTWRQYGSFLDAVNMFRSITGIDLLKDYEPRTILRTPKKFLPAHVGIRIFVARYLPKISDRLFDQPPEKDVLLLRKLSTSKYDVEDKAYLTYAEQEHSNEIQKLKRNRLKVGMSTLSVVNRNSATDWNTVKGAARIRRARR